MVIGVTGGTGFLGRYLVRRLADAGHRCRCWARAESDCGGFDGIEDSIEWIEGDLTDVSSMEALANGADAVVHSALYRPGAGFRGAEGNVPQIGDEGELRELVRRVIAEHEDAVVRFRHGHEGSLGFLVGQVMRATRGRANPTMTNDLLRRALKEP